MLLLVIENVKKAYFHFILKYRHHADDDDGPLFGKLLVFSLPIMAMSILQLLFDTADMAVVGRFSGGDALVAVGATGTLINLIITLFTGLSVGTSVAVARDYTADDVDAVSRSVHTSIVLSMVGGLIVMAVGIAFRGPLLIMIGMPENILGLVVLYMRVHFVSMPASIIFTFGTAIMRSVSDSRRPMYFLGVTGILHVVLNLFFVIVLHMNVDGVAWSTVIPQYLSALLILSSLSRYDGAIRFIPRKLKADKEKLRELIRIGLPVGLQDLLFSISNVLTQSAVNSFSPTMIAVSAATMNTENYIGTVMLAYYNAVVAFAAQSMGAKKYSRIDNIAKVSTVLVLITWTLLGGAAVLPDRPLLDIPTSDLKMIELGMLRLYIIMISLVACGIMDVYPGSSYGMGYSISPMLCTLVGACLLRMVWLATIFAWYPAELVLFVAYPVTWVLAGAGQVVTFSYARQQIHKQATAVQPIAESEL